MSAPTAGMDVDDPTAIETNSADIAATADVTMRDDAGDGAQAAGGNLSELTHEAKNVYVTGGEFTNTHFGPKIEYHHHHHYNESTAPEARDQLGPSHRSQRPDGARTVYTQESQELEVRIVPPQEGQESDENSIKQLTDKLWVDMNSKNRLSKIAQIYRGYQDMSELCPRRLTAVKIVPYQKNRKREAKNLLKLSPHSNVVLVIHADILPGSPILKQIYIVMEQCQPLTLEEYIENRQKDNLPFNTKQAIDFARQIISGMKHIHEKDIVHRDLKPSSVLFSLDGKNLKIIDFGVSKELENGLTTMSVSTRIGTDGYRAPETYKDKTGKHMKKPADVYSLGILLCHIWSYGVHPFGDDGTLWAHNIKKGNPPDFSNLLIPEPDKAKDLLKKMLKYNQAERYTVLDVEKHEYICQGVESTILSEMDNVWSGSIKVTGNDDTNPFDCKVFERKDKNVLGLRDEPAQLQMLYVPLTRMTQMVEGVLKVPPNGYVAVSKDVYLKRLKRQFEREMGWINAFRNKDRIGAFIIFQPRDYEELICIFIEKPEEFLNRLRVATSEEETVPKEPVPESADLPQQEDDIQEAEMVLSTPALQPTVDESDEPAVTYQDATGPEAPHSELLKAIQGTFESRLQADDEEENVAEKPAESREVEIGQPEHISWWIYRPINPGEQASAQTGQ